MRIATILRRYRTRRHLLAVCLTSIVMALQPVRSVAVDRLTLRPTTDSTSSGYEVAGRLCIAQERCGLITITVRSAEDRFRLAPTR